MSILVLDRDMAIEVTSTQTLICDGYTLEFDDYLKQEEC